MFWTDILMI